MRLCFKLLASFLIISGMLFGVLFFNHTITNLDRPFFLSGKKETIVATYIGWMCNSANFVETTKYKIDPITEPKRNDYFFIESAIPELAWDKELVSKYRNVRLTGQFYIDKGISTDFELGAIEDKPEHARIFRFEKIEYLSSK